MQTLMGSKCLVLVPLPTAAGSARRYVRRTLVEFGYNAKIDDAELVVSELVSNAVKANPIPARRSAETPSQSDADVIRVGLSIKPGAIRIEVWDGNPAGPVPAAPGDEDESGRGLLLVGLLSIGWGTWWPPDGGKIVWCELPI
ncbi:ATP-binding protein [Sphaerisporangium sp. NPDC049002]|uniref:ATP-binding protein n=1 Tax=unclassified Sphaerisporangium TaxID=2630420 RepID=UPI0033DA5B3D